MRGKGDKTKFDGDGGDLALVDLKRLDDGTDFNDDSEGILHILAYSASEY